MIIHEKNVGSFFRGTCLKCKKAAVFLDTDGEGKFWAQCEDHEHCNHSIVVKESWQPQPNPATGEEP